MHNNNNNNNNTNARLTREIAENRDMWRERALKAEADVEGLRRLVSCLLESGGRHSAVVRESELSGARPLILFENLANEMVVSIM